MNTVQTVQRKIFYLFSPFLRIFHWVMVDSIIVLFVTGILIGKPLGIMSLEPTQTIFLMDLVRKLHFLAAFVFCSAIILRIYGFIINRGDRLFPRFWEGHFYAETIDVALHYMLLKKSHKSYLRNPLARMSYAFLYVLVAIEILTGFAMYNMTEPMSIGGQMFGWVNVVLGGVPYASRPPLCGVGDYPVCDRPSLHGDARRVHGGRERSVEHVLGQQDFSA